MTLNTPNWETNINSLALEGLGQTNPPVEITEYNDLLQAYEQCAAITKEHSKTFHLASSLLPGHKRDAVRVLYAFCRISDDLVDRPNGNPIDALQEWQKRTTGSEEPGNNTVALAWADVRTNFRIPVIYARQLIDGVRQDLTKSRYQDFSELASYAYKVASTVGLMSMHIIGYSTRDAVPHAVKMGVALQLTNILRDVAEDWQAGRLYLPQDEMEAFGISEEDIAAGTLSHHWRTFMAYQVERNRQLYKEAWSGIAMLNQEGRMAIGAAARLYEAILDDIEAHDFDVFTRRSYVPKRKKISMLPGIWQEVRRF